MRDEIAHSLERAYDTKLTDGELTPMIAHVINARTPLTAWLAEDRAQLENHLAAKRKAIAVCNQGVVQKLYDVISELGWEPRRRNVFYELVDGRSDQVLETGPQSTVSIDLPVLASAT